MRIPLLVFINYRTVAKIILFIIPIIFLARIYLPNQPVEITYKALRWEGEVSVVNEQCKKDIVDALKFTHRLRQPGPPQKMALYSLTVERGKKKEVYFITEYGDYFCSDGMALLPSYKLRELTQNYITRLERQSPYGQLVPWTDVRHIFGRYVKATVEDVETRLRFDVQRRAGSYHADVQPLTARDTAIMKEIYEGNWSWKRRAVIVEVDNKRIAASMSGMPHGAGAIRHNDFNGHFCIHFKDSTTHQNPETPNLAHQMMVWKAAGRVPEMLAMTTPERLVEIFLTALDQNDEDYFLLTLAGEPELDAKGYLEQVKEIKNLSYSNLTFNPEANIIIVDIKIDFFDGREDVTKDITLQMVHSLGYWWKIDPRSVGLLFKKE